MPGRASGEAAGGYGAPGGNMGGMGTTNAGAGAGAGGMGTTDAGPSTVHLNAGSRGVVGLGGLSLSEGPQGAVITSDKKFQRELTNEIPHIGSGQVYPTPASQTKTYSPVY